MTYDVQRWTIHTTACSCATSGMERTSYGPYVLAADAEAHERQALAVSKDAAATAIRDAADVAYEQAIRDAYSEASIALMAMDGFEFTPEQHNSVVDAILALLEDK